jgi:hypothetical protein
LTRFVLEFDFALACLFDGEIFNINRLLNFVGKFLSLDRQAATEQAKE